MTKKIGTNLNSSTDSDEFKVLVNSTTAVQLIPEVLGAEPDHVSVEVYNESQFPLWVRKRAAFVDNEKTGIQVGPNETKDIVKNSAVYRGEYSAILDSGPDKQIFVVVT